MQLENNLATSTTWDIYEERFIPEQAVTTGSNYMIGNGYLGYRGTFADDRASRYVACVLTDTYDNADGKWKELVTAPNGLFTELTANGVRCSWSDDTVSGYRRVLDFRYGEWSASAAWTGGGITAFEERFSSYADLHLLTSRMHVNADRAVRLEIRTGIDGAVWSLNGDHFSSMNVETFSTQLEAAAVTVEHRYDIVVRELSILTLDGGAAINAHRITTGEREIYRLFVLDLDAGQTVVLTKYTGLYSSNDPRGSGGITGNVEDVRRAAAESVTVASEADWNTLRDLHRKIWDSRWADMDIALTGDDIAQTVLRYNLYHNVIATPAHTDHLPIGARGLSCQAYQGAAFWDQEIFNLPMFLFTAPETARNILVYRYRTLDGARKKARDLGYQGAFYAWISADTGEEICPPYFFRDVISGRRIRNHFNDWQIHISPDIAYTIWKYVTVTGDTEYLTRYGAEIVFEIARFIVSRVHYRKDRERYEVVRVLGPDEYHENVDNNYFTNFQMRFAARYASDVYRWMEGCEADALKRLRSAINLDPEECEEWQDVAQNIFVPEPDPQSGLIEQFSGFFTLEDTTPEEISERLLDPGEYWGWPNGIAVETQVSKQADVVQLFVLHPEASSRSVMKANWEYYEPRTQHGSSLSYAVYAISAAWVEHTEEAYRYFLRSCTVDLYNTGKSVSGGTFIGGIHTAACGAAWQIVVNGFLGMEVRGNAFCFSPNLPKGWERVSVVLKRRGARLSVTAEPDRLILVGDAGNAERVEVSAGETVVSVAPGTSEVLPLKR